MLQLSVFFKETGCMSCSRKLVLAVAIISLLTAGKGFAQSDVGIKFENGLSWSKILEKAKKENKFIFVDGYTTWCGPCKQMAQDVFPRQEVGEFFNQNFINVAVQFDVTSLDNSEIKNWYADAKMMEDKYKVDSYPTYLYFTPQGNLIHTLIGSNSAQEFIEKSKLALDPKTQFTTLKQQYRNGNRDSAFLANIASVAYNLRDQDSLRYYAQDYLRLQRDLFSPLNLKLIGASAKKSTDIGFLLLKNHPKQADSVIGAGASRRIVKYIASNEIVRPLTRLNLTITEYGGGMVIYGGEIIPDADWLLIETKLNAEYPDLAVEMIRQAKLEHFQELKDWKRYALVIDDWRGYNDGVALERDELDNYLRALLEQCGDKDVLKSALKWSKQNMMADKSNLSYILTHNKLLYKNDKRKAAVKNMRDFVKIDSSYQSDALTTLDKMAKGGEMP